MILSERMLTLMDKKDRAPLGKAGVTFSEAQAHADVKSEKQLQIQIENWFRLNGIPAFRQRMDRKSNMPIGTPDFLICFRGRFYALEAKVGSNHLTTEQANAIQDIQRAGGSAFVVKSLNDVLPIFAPKVVNGSETTAPESNPERIIAQPASCEAELGAVENLKI